MFGYNPFSRNRYSRVERLENGDWFYELMNSSSSGSKFKSEHEKLQAIINSWSALKVFKMNSDMLSLGQLKSYENKKEVQDSDIIKLLKDPNPVQTGNQFLWDYCFYRMLGTAMLYRTSRVINERTRLFWLEPSRIKWDNKVLNKLKELPLSTSSTSELEKLTFKYQFHGNKFITIALSEVKPFFDLSNGFGNWYQGISRVDSLQKIICNSESALNAKGSNLDFAGKFMLFGKNAMEDTSELPMSEPEKRSLENSVNSSKRVHATKTPLGLHRFVENLGNLKLDEADFASYYKIGNSYSVPRDVLEAELKGSAKHKNLEDSKAGWIEQSIAPAAKDLMNGVSKWFNADIDSNRISYEHLSFMQVFRRKRQEAIKIDIENISAAKEAGAINEEEAKREIRKLVLDE